jgi:hypothetical protein
MPTSDFRTPIPYLKKGDKVAITCPAKKATHSHDGCG